MKSGKNDKTSIKDVLISYDEDWVGEHLRSIKTAYGTAPYFEYYFDEIKAIMNSNFSKLWDLNISILEWIIRRMELDFKIQYTSVWHKMSPFHDMRSKMKATVNQDKLIEYQVRPYPQVFEYKYGYRVGASSLDLLMCLGPESKKYLKI